MLDVLILFACGIGGGIFGWLLCQAWVWWRGRGRLP
jgi:hypothetical protein